MFHTRITEAWGAPAVVRDRYLLERKVELSSGAVLLCGRERASGILRWIKFATSPEDVSALTQEAAALSACTHARLATITDRSKADADMWFALDWQGETPWDDELRQRPSAIDRLRMAPALVEVIEALAVARVAVPALSLEHLWVSPSLHWLRLVGLPGAIPQANHESICEMRAAAAKVLEQIATWNAAEPAETCLPELVSKWGNSEEQALDELQNELDRALLMAVTADL